MTDFKKILMTTAWYAYAVLMSVITLGVFIRFHLITVRKRTLHGVRAGTYGGIHVYREERFIVVSKMLGKNRLPISQVAYAQTRPFTVRLETSGGIVTKIPTWQTRLVADFANAQIHVHS